TKFGLRLLSFTGRTQRPRISRLKRFWNAPTARAWLSPYGRVFTFMLYNTASLIVLRIRGDIECCLKPRRDVAGFFAKGIPIIQDGKARNSYPRLRKYRRSTQNSCVGIRTWGALLKTRLQVILYSV